MSIPKHCPTRNALATCLATAFALTSMVQQTVASGNTIVVTNCTDTGGTGTTLRSAIAGASDTDAIDLKNCVNSTITLTSGEIAIAQQSLTIVGPKDNSLAISGNHNGRIFDHTATGVLAVQYVTLTGGQISGTSGLGGCIYSHGSVTLSHSTISGCSAATLGAVGVASGGGLFAVRSVTMDYSRVTGNSVSAPSVGGYSFGGGVVTEYGFTAHSSTIDHNVASGEKTYGGGIYAIRQVDVESTTISSNEAVWGAGIYIHYGQHLLNSTKFVNSTISGNHAAANGAIYSAAATPISIFNTTVAFNTAGDRCAGVVITNLAPVTLDSSILANNQSLQLGTADLYLFPKATINGSSANNLVISANSVPPGTLTSDPQLGPLAFHGGPTQTHSLNPDSPAVDTGSNVELPALTTDQRGAGFAREVPSGKADMGAYERQVDDDEIFYGGFD